MMIGNIPTYNRFDIERLAQPAGEADTKHGPAGAASQPAASLSPLGSKLVGQLHGPVANHQIAGMKAFLEGMMTMGGWQLDQKWVDTRLANKTVQQAAQETLQILSEGIRQSRFARVINDMEQEFPEDFASMSQQVWQGAVDAAATALHALQDENPLSALVECTGVARLAFIAHRNALDQAG